MKQVFISSTFKDMQFERDLINAKVAPRLNLFLQKYAEKVHFGDLRWGVNTTELESEDCSKKVLSVCLDQIEECKPYMIILIGERYGWIPPAELLTQAAKSKGIDENMLEEDISVTQLEIEYGALLNPDLEGRVLFYFRNPIDLSKMSEKERAGYLAESEIHKQKIEKLKERIRAIYPNSIKYYSAEYDEASGKIVALDDFAEQVYQDLSAVLDKDLAHFSSLCPQERALLNSHTFFTELAEDSYFLDDEEIYESNLDAIEYYYEFRYETNPLFELITGESGSGGKTLTAQKYLKAKKEGYNVFCFAYAIDEFTSSPQKVNEAIVYKLEKLLERKQSNKYEYDYICELFEEYSNSDLPHLHLYFINFLQNSLILFHHIASKLPNLTGVSFHVHFKYPLEEGIPLPFFLKNKITTPQPLDDERAIGVVNAILKANRKELPPVVINEMVKRESGDNPLYLSLLTQRLINFDSEDFANIRAMGDGMDNINKYMIEMIRSCGDDVKALAKDLFLELTQRIDRQTALHLISHLTLPFHFEEEGIRDLLEFAGWKCDALSYAIFKNTFPLLFKQNSKGILFFASEKIQAAAVEILEENGISSDIDVIIEFLKSGTEKYTRKGFCYMYYVKGDSRAFLEHILRYNDIALPEYSKLEKGSFEDERFKAYAKYFLDILEDSLSKGGEFALAVVRDFCEMVADGTVKNPYTIISFMLSFLEPDYSDYEEMTATLEFIIKAIGEIEKVNADRKSEVLDVFNNILRTLYVPTFYGKIANAAQIEFCSKNNEYMTKYGQELTLKQKDLVAQRLISLGRAANRRTTSFINVYTMIKKSENPSESPAFVGFCSFCESFEQLAYDKHADFYGELMAGNKSLGREEGLAFWLAMNAFRYNAVGDLERAKINYDAFFAMHNDHYQEEGMDAFFIPDYLNLCTDACVFFARYDDEETALYKINRLYEWGLETLSDNFMNVNIATALLRMKLDVDQTELKDFNQFSSFYQIFNAIYTRLEYGSESQTVPLFFRLFATHTFLFSAEEKAKYFIDFAVKIFKTLNGKSGVETSDVFDEIGYYAAYFAYMTEEDESELLQAGLEKIFEEYPDLKGEEEEFFKIAIGSYRYNMEE